MKIIEYHNIRIELRSFKPEGGIAEYHAMLHVIGKDKPFDGQLQDMLAACSRLPSVCGEGVRPVFGRCFLSDAANQMPLTETCELLTGVRRLSMVQQPPLDGSKIAIWVYLKQDAEVVSSGRLFAEEHNGYRHVWTAGRHVPHGDARRQTDALLREYAGDLEREGCTLENDCVRTWLFVQNVDVNYPEVVQARKEVFADHRLTEQTHYIASTGIEGRHAHTGAYVLLDAYAVKGLRQGQQRYLYAPGHLNRTSEYGVTFERGVSVEYGDRSHIFISGTASINNRGEIVHPGDIAGQTHRMLENMAALLAEAEADFDDVLQMIVYLRDIADYHAVNAIFEERFGNIPKVITLASVCRSGWLVETECIAVGKKRHPQFNPL
ncbi:MAG: hypothetical protein LBR08_10010 [Bacteroidales bacterium]|nr:hypothetical protein [Bacteroidales bacterium]